MPLSGAQKKQTQKALLAAFGDEDNLRQMLMLQMSVNLDSVAKPGNVVQRTYDVVEWTKNQGSGCRTGRGRMRTESPKS